MPRAGALVCRRRAVARSRRPDRGHRDRRLAGVLPERGAAPRPGRRAARGTRAAAGAARRAVRRLGCRRPRGARRGARAAAVAVAAPGLPGLRRHDRLAARRARRGPPCRAVRRVAARGDPAGEHVRRRQARAPMNKANQVNAVSGWPELVSVALLGTERRDPPLPADPALAGLAGAAGGRQRSAEERLLSAAGALAVLRRAGRLAPPAPPLPEPAPAEPRPACGAAAAYRLTLLLDDQRALLPEWLRAVAGRGLRVPAERLPDLLEAGTASQAMRRDVEPVLGERGPWLAAQVPRWSWAAPLPATAGEREALWRTGTRPQRHRLFALLRRTRPDEARQLLYRGLAREEAADRAWFIAALGEGLAPADEPLLETALDDRRQEVRAAAARLLARLPGSAFARRMTDRTVPLVRVDRGGIIVALPDDLDEAAIRDGVIRRPSSGTGERAWWLHQLVAATPLPAWDAVGL